MIVLALLFLATACLYASVGFGGGSTYNALLVLNGTDYRLLPSIALICNLIVVSGGTLRFAREGLLRWRDLLPFLAGSVPLAWIGGRLSISETVFTGLLGASLLASAVHLLSTSATPEQPTEIRARKSTFTSGKGVALASGAGIGLLSGLVGIGGGIFLAPLLYLGRWGSPREIAAASSLFILVNSLSGLAGQVTKLTADGSSLSLIAYWPLFLAVLLGGQIGSRLGAKILPEPVMKRATALLIAYVALRLLWRWQGLVFT
ncbi:MAG: sulfite exporter TauE/SafE family protein [Pseudomonadota bacterium]